MRKLYLMFLVVGVAGCDSSRGTSPESTVINVRLRDDLGAPAGRNQVVVTQSETNRVNARTRDDGMADIHVLEAGVYSVRVVPRDGYVGTMESLSKSVSVAANEKVVVEFTLYRAARSEPNPPPPGW